MRNHLVMQRLSVNGHSSIYNSKKKGDTMTYLEKWFDFNRRQKEIESLLEETIAQQSEQRLTLKEFYLLYYLDLAQEKSLRQIDLPDKLHLSPSAVSRWWLAWKLKIAVYSVAGVAIKIGAPALSA